VTLRHITSHTELLDASAGSAFVRYDIPSPLTETAYAVDGAVALPRLTHVRRRVLLVMGAPEPVDRLMAQVVAGGLHTGMTAVTVTRESLAAVAAHLPLTDGNDWEWMCTSSAPSVVSAEARLEPLSRDALGDIRTLLEEANPGTDARPFESPDQQWVGARDDVGRLVACGVREPAVSGWPILSGITVHPDARGTGLGLAVTAHLTRSAVADRGVCTLGMYSHNDVARRVYLGLGYRDVHAWSSRRLAR
jgi:ribosomal protein S18 acetylase RimI-like enzyme